MKKELKMIQDIKDLLLDYEKAIQEKNTVLLINKWHYPHEFKITYSDFKIDHKSIIIQKNNQIAYVHFKWSANNEEIKGSQYHYYVWNNDRWIIDHIDYLRDPHN